MKKFSDWWKEKYQCPMWGFHDEPEKWALQRFLEAAAEYLEENVEAIRMSNKL